MENKMNDMKILRNSNGITIKQLKQLIKDLPEKDQYGEDYTVWMSSDEGYSNAVKAIWPLNKREDGQDIIFESVY